MERWRHSCARALRAILNLYSVVSDLMRGDDLQWTLLIACVAKLVDGVKERI